MPMVKSAVILFYISMVAMPPVGDVEPNDMLDDAIETGLTDLGTVIVSDGVIGNGEWAEGDNDLFAIHVSDDAELPLLVTVAMTAVDPELDGFAVVFDAVGLNIARNNDGNYPDLDPFLSAHLLEPGTYYVAVAHKGVVDPTVERLFQPPPGPLVDGMAYELVIVLEPGPSLLDSLEPSPDEDLPLVIESLPFLARNQFIGDGPALLLDVDPYWVVVDGPAILTVVVTPTGFQALDPFVQLTVSDSKGVAVIEPFERKRPDLRVARLEVAIFEPSAVAIEIRGTLPPLVSEDVGVGTVGFYDISIEAAAVNSGGGPLEPNDSLLEATPVDISKSGMANFSAVIGDGPFGEFRGDVDFYEIPLQSDARVEVTVTPTGGADGLEPVVHLYHYLGFRMNTWYADETGVVHFVYEPRCADLLHRMEFDDDGSFDAATATIAVMGARDRPTIDPMVSAINGDPASGFPRPMMAKHLLDGGPGSTGSYDITISVGVNEGAGCGNEPDDSIGDLTGPVLVDTGVFKCTAGRLNDGSCVEGEEHRNVDLFAVSLNAPPAVLDVRLAGQSCGDRKTLIVFDGDGARLAMVRNGSSNPPSPDVDAHIRIELTKPGSYYVGVSHFGNDGYHPDVACAGQGIWNERSSDAYELEIRLIPQTASQGSSVAPSSQTAKTHVPRSRPTRSRELTAGGDALLFATSFDPFANTVVDIDPSDGRTLASLASPESPLGGVEGLAIQGDDLLLLGSSGQYPILYRLDAVSGAVVDETLTWFGSGVYGGMVHVGDRLFIVDMHDEAIHAVRSDLSGPVERIEFEGFGDFSLWGAITATAGGDRLFVTDAVDPTLLHEIDAVTGAVRSSISLSSPCLCDADFDGDGNVDLNDAEFFDDCVALDGVSFGCHAADLNCDGDVNEDDMALFDCQNNGVDLPPHDDCCPDGLATFVVRATGLASVGPDVLIASDWARRRIHKFTSSGDHAGGLVADYPVGGICGTPLTGAGDGDFDGDSDLLDWGLLQVCFGHSGPPEVGCSTFDFDLDVDVDIDDFDAFVFWSVGGLP